MYVMMKLQHIFKIIDRLVYTALIICAAYCIIASNVIQNFANQTTDTYKSEIVFNDIVALPEFSFCDWSFRISNMDGLYEIEYYISDNAFYDWNIVENIVIRPLYTNCFIVDPPPEMELSYERRHMFSIKFNSSVVELPQLTGYLSKKNNLRLLGRSHDGDPIYATIQPSQKVWFVIEEERTEYLLENCRDEPIIEYVTSQLKHNYNCPVKCRMNYSISSGFDESMKMYPICTDDQSSLCFYQWLHDLLNHAKKYCWSTSYTGKVDFESIYHKGLNCSKVLKFTKSYGIKWLIFLMFTGILPMLSCI